ncbi:MAG: hypothetical protein HXS49_07185, partial [Theionarchaea archaeon]|nr:hypothetical protein [Theionarchaea archaeon]
IERVELIDVLAHLAICFLKWTCVYLYVDWDLSGQLHKDGTHHHHQHDEDFKVENPLISIHSCHLLLILLHYLNHMQEYRREKG